MFMWSVELLVHAVRLQACSEDHGCLPRLQSSNVVPFWGLSVFRWDTRYRTQRGNTLKGLGVYQMTLAAQRSPGEAFNLPRPNSCSLFQRVQAPNSK